jgi:YD repeat-containing protein
MNESVHDELVGQLAERMGVKRRWSRGYASKAVVYVLFGWMAFVLSVPLDMLACACSEVAIGSATLNSSLSVNSNNASLDVVQGDIELPGIVPVNLTRVYNSGHNRYTMFGYGWDVPFVSSITTWTTGVQVSVRRPFLVPTTTYHVVWRMGQQTYFKPTDAGYYSLDETERLVSVGPNEVKVVNRMGHAWHYNTLDGTLIKEVDANGNETTYTWKIVAKKTGIFEAMVGGEAPIYTNRDVNQSVYCPLSVTFPCGRSITFEYSTVPGQEYLCTKAISPSGFEVEYSYTNGLLTGIEKSNSQYLEYEYRTLVDSYKTMGWLSKIIYANGAEIEIEYETGDQGDATQVRSVKGPHGYEKEYTFSLGSSPDSRQVVETNSRNNSTTFYHLNDDTLTRETNALSDYMEVEKTGKRKVTSIRDYRGKVYSLDYDDSNPDRFKKWNVTGITNPLSRTTEFEYNGQNRVTKITDPLNIETNITYDTNGINPIAFKNGLDETWLTLGYTNKGQVESIKDGADNETELTYNSSGFLTQIKDPLANEWDFTYDSAGNLLTTTTPLGNTTTITYNGFYLPASIEDPLENTTLFTYDEMANLTEVEDAEGNKVELEYDLLQRVTKITNALNHEIGFEYDTESNLTKLIDPLGRQYGYTYDALNRTATWSHPSGGGTETYAYDANSNLTSFTDAGGNQLTYGYDDADRRTSLTWQQGGTNTVFEYSYNDADQLTGVTRKYGMTTQSTYSYSYDGAARLTSVTADGRTIGFDYDATQKVSQLVYPSSLEVNLEYNELGVLHAIRDDSNNVVAGYVYDDDGQLTKRMLENGLETVYEYNDAGWVTKVVLRETATPANVLQSFEYGYDKVGNRLWTKYLGGRGDVYQYDASYQVTGVKYDVDDPTDGYALATGAARTVTYAYDAAGNRTSVVDSASTTTTYTVNNLNQYTSVGVVVPVYSDEGYLVEYGDWEYSYDHAGNLVNATDGVVNITYAYDAAGRRVSRSDGVNTVYYLYNGLNLIEERDGLNNVLAEYIYDGTLLPRNEPVWKSWTGCLTKIK